MDDFRLIFTGQLLTALCAWWAIADYLIRPRLKGLDQNTRLSIWIAPQMFRIVGLGLLVPRLSPGMPLSFAFPTALGDGLTSLLSIVAFFALSGRSPDALKIAWVAAGVGILDLVVALPHATLVHASEHMATQWYIAALGVPLMIVSHIMCVRVLLEQRKRRG
jgi:hypothetical protein